MAIDAIKTGVVDLPRPLVGKGEGDAGASPSAVHAAASQNADRRLSEADLKQLTQLVNEINRSNKKLLGNQLQIEVEPDMKLSVIKIVDVQSKEVIRQIPSEEALARLQAIQAYLSRQHEAQGSEGIQKPDLMGLLLETSG